MTYGMEISEYSLHHIQCHSFPRAGSSILGVQFVDGDEILWMEL